MLLSEKPLTYLEKEKNPSTSSEMWVRRPKFACGLTMFNRCSDRCQLFEEKLCGMKHKVSGGTASVSDSWEQFQGKRSPSFTSPCRSVWHSSCDYCYCVCMSALKDTCMWSLACQIRMQSPLASHLSVLVTLSCRLQLHLLLSVCLSVSAVAARPECLLKLNKQGHLYICRLYRDVYMYDFPFFYILHPL